jgi:hypothetical protein
MRQVAEEYRLLLRGLLFELGEAVGDLVAADLIHL